MPPMPPIPTLFVGLPTLPPSDQPVIDTLTRRLVAALHLRRLEPIPGRPGVIVCNCGADPMTDQSFLVGPQHARLRVNPFCVHHIAFHRKEMNLTQLALVSKLGQDEEEPLAEQLRRPTLRQHQIVTIADIAH